MKLTREQVRHVALLARLGLSDERLDALGGELTRILDYIDQINQLDTEAIPPTAQVGDLGNVMRDDAVGSSLPVRVALANAPDSEGDCFRVRAMQE
jgi:aspartyl-tRNA(Asn)/glutamyl-tRNA(Gln) amidotransferase subunit C